MKKTAPSLGLIGIAITLILGLIAELFRFKGVLLIDLWVPIFATAWLIQMWLKAKKPKLPKFTYPAALFALIGFASLLINSADMSWAEFTEASFYPIRWTGMLMLAVIAANESKVNKVKILWLIFIFALILSLAGFIQLRLVPDFTAFETLGWDPHQGRLLATWFDPNFVGGFLAFIMPILIGTAFEKKKWRPYLMPAGIIITIALVLTLSRSSYLAFLAGIIVFSLFRSWKFLVVMGLLLVLLVASSARIQDRVTDLTESIQSVFVESYTLPDPSARLRFGSWDEAWQLFLEKPLLGHGYNRYGEAALQLGTIKDTEVHSANGSDSSLLTILATTGLAGFIPFLLTYILIAKQAWQHRKNGYALGLLAALVGLFVHSIFVNSLLFPLFMAPMWILVGLFARQPK